jgi:hypothetical protein
MLKTVKLPDGNIFTGEFKGDVRNGVGVKTYINGATYDGYWLDDLRHGKGIKTQSNGTQTCVEYHNGKKVTLSDD